MSKQPITVNLTEYMDEVKALSKRVEEGIYKIDFTSLDKVLKRMAKPKKTVEPINLNVGGYTFSDEGFEYNSFFVGDANDGEEIQLDFMGEVITVALHKGFNQLNIPSGTRIVPSKNFRVICMRSTYSLKEGEI